MGGYISKDAINERWIREPSLFNFPTYADPGEPGLEGRPVVPVFRRHRAQPHDFWVDEAVEIPPEPPRTRSSSAPPSIAPTSASKKRPGGLFWSYYTDAQKRLSLDNLPLWPKKSPKPVDTPAPKPKKEKPIKKEKSIKKKKKFSKKATPATTPATTRPSSSSSSSSSSVSSVAPAAPPPPPEPVYSFANPRFAKVGTAPPVVSAALKPSGRGDASQPYSFANPRVTPYPRTVAPIKPTYTQGAPLPSKVKAAELAARVEAGRKKAVRPVTSSSSSSESSASEEVVVRVVMKEKATTSLDLLGGGSGTMMFQAVGRGAFGGGTLGGGRGGGGKRRGKR